MAPNGPNLVAELQALLAEGRKIEAIKRYREATAVGLAEAKAAVESLERGESPSTKQSEDSSFETEIVSLLQGGKKIEAIKLYRERTGVGLKEAKDFIDALAADPRVATTPKSGCLGVVLLLMAIPVAAIVFAGEPPVRSSKELTLADALAVIQSKVSSHEDGKFV